MIVAAALVVSSLAQTSAARPLDIERLATCQDSWLEWKDDPARINAYVTSFRASFTPKEGTAYFEPRTKMTVARLPVTQVYPESIGMAVGFSVIVEGSFATTKKNVEALVGKPLGKCEGGDEMTGCTLEIADKKTLTLMAPGAGSKTTLVGCYYFFEK